MSYSLYSEEARTLIPLQRRTTAMLGTRRIIPPLMSRTRRRIPMPRKMEIVPAPRRRILSQLKPVLPQPGQDKE